MLKGPLWGAFPSTIVYTTGQECNVHSHGNTYNGQFLSSEYSFDTQCALYTGKEFPSQSSLLTMIINFSKDIIFMEKIFLNKLDAQHSHYTSLENVTLAYLYAFDQFADFAFL